MFVEVLSVRIFYTKY